MGRGKNSSPAATNHHRRQEELVTAVTPHPVMDQHRDRADTVTVPDHVGDAFSSTFGAGRGRVVPDHPKVAPARSLLADGDLVATCRLVARHGLVHGALLSDLADALTERVLRERWAGRARRLLDLTAAYPATASTIVKSTYSSDTWLVHLWPAGVSNRWLQTPADPVTVCGLNADDQTDAAPRGAWLTPSVCGRGAPERWRRCPACAPSAALLPEAQQIPDYPVFAMQHFRPVVASVRETLLSDLHADPRTASLTRARKIGDPTDESMLQAVARSAKGGGHETWNLALNVTRKSASKGLTEDSVRVFLPGVEDPSALLDEHDWLDALRTITLRTAHGTWSLNHINDFHKALWRRTLQNFDGVPHHDADSGYLQRYSVCF